MCGKAALDCQRQSGLTFVFNQPTAGKLDGQVRGKR